MELRTFSLFLPHFTCRYDAPLQEKGYNISCSLFFISCEKRASGLLYFLTEPPATCAGGFDMQLDKEHIGYQHQAKACQKGIGGATLASVGMGFGNHFVADDVKLSSAGKCQGKRQDR